MPNGLWIRLDIPYSERASKMRAVLGYLEDNAAGQWRTLRLDAQPDIPVALDGILKSAGESGVKTDSTLVVVFAHDARHGLAWTVKEDADRRGLGFARHVPDAVSLPPELMSGYEELDTGSPEDVLSPGEAHELVLALNSDAQENYQSGDLLEAMSPLRHALWLSLRHLGWQNPLTAYTIRNLGYTLYATGNDDNIAETVYLIRRLLKQWDIKSPQAADWSNSISLLETMVQLCGAIGMEEPASAIQCHIDRLKAV